LEVERKGLVEINQVFLVSESARERVEGSF